MCFAYPRRAPPEAQQTQRPGRELESACRPPGSATTIIDYRYVLKGRPTMSQFVSRTPSYRFATPLAEVNRMTRTSAVISLAVVLSGAAALAQAPAGPVDTHILTAK